MRPTCSAARSSPGPCSAPHPVSPPSPVPSPRVSSPSQRTADAVSGEPPAEPRPAPDAAPPAAEPRPAPDAAPPAAERRPASDAAPPAAAGGAPHGPAADTFQGPPVDGGPPAGPVEGAAPAGATARDEMPRLRLSRRGLALAALFVASCLAFLYFVLPKVLGLRDTW